MNKPSNSEASNRYGGRALYSIAVVAMLVMVSGVAVIASSGGLLSKPLDASMQAVSTGLVIANVTYVPDEAYVDEEVVWTVFVDLQDQGQRGKGLLFTWDWDDGTYTVHHLNSINNSDIALDVQTHAWSEAGTYEVMVSVWDGYGNENNKWHNVSETVQYVVNEGAADRVVDYRWYDMFAHELGPWYAERAAYYGDECVLTDEYPYLYTWEKAPPGNVQVRSFMRMEAFATNLSEINMDDNPEFLPQFGATSGGSAFIDWHMDYVTRDEAEEKLSDAVMAWYDGWFIALNGTVVLDREGAKAVLGLSDSQYDDFDSWWASNEYGVELMWRDWLDYEASNERLAIFNMYEYDLTLVYFDIEASTFYGDQIMIELDTISWGMEALMTRWLHEAFMPTEWYMEDMDLYANIFPDSAEIYFDAAVGYALTASESLVDGTPCWTWQAMLQDYSESTPEYPISDFDPYADQYYYLRYPGNDWYHEMMPYDFTPGSWNLSAGETLTFEWPGNEVLFFIDDANDSGTGLLDGAIDFWSTMTVDYSEPMPSDSPDKVVLDQDERWMKFTGPFDMWSWSRDQIAHSYLADEWDRLGMLPYGIPYIEFKATGEFNSPPLARVFVDPLVGGVDTVFTFDARSSSDVEDPSTLLVARWDWQSDGVWDTAYSTEKLVEHVFSDDGVHVVTVQVMDSGGLTDEASVSVEVTDLRSWGTPTLLELDDAGNAWSPIVDINSDGEAIAVWSQFDGAYDRIMANRYYPDTGWSGAEVIGANSRNATSPQVAMNHDGSAVVVWSEYDILYSSVWAMLYAPDTGWGIPTLLKSVPWTLECIPQCSLAGDLNGRAIAVWNQEDGPYSSIWACRLDYDGVWAEPELIETSDSGNAWSPKIVSDQGNWTVVWQQYGDGWESIWGSRYFWYGDGWSEPVMIDTDDSWSTFNPDVAADAYGHAICVWQQYENSFSSIYASRFVPGVGWGTPVMIEHNDSGDSVDPQIAMEPTGDAVVVWKQIDGHEIDGGSADIVSCRYEAGIGWGSEVYLDSDPATDVWGQKISMAYKAGPVVIWMRDDGVRWTVWGSLFDDDSGWGAPELVCNPDAIFACPSDVTINSAGTAIAVWHQYQNGVWSIWSNMHGPVTEPPTPEPLIKVSDGTSVTVYEQTGEVYSYAFSVDQLMTTGGTFTTVAMLIEEYTITSDGDYLTVHCFRDPYTHIPGTGTGNNIVAVRLDGVPEYPDGLWASSIVDYSVGYGGIAESRFNALGPADQVGPYIDSLCTYLGDYDSEIVLAFTGSSAPPGETSLTYTIYDMFEEPWGEWWDKRPYGLWDTDRLLTDTAGEVTMLSSVWGLPMSTSDDQGIIYAPYRYNVTGTNLPNIDVHTPTFMPVLGSGPNPEAEASLDIRFQYGYQELWDNYWVPTWGDHDDWADWEDLLSYWDDGWYVYTVYTVDMNHEAAEEWLGVGATDDPDDWWTVNEDAYVLAWDSWVLEQGNEVYDIFCGYEWPYTILSTTMMRLTGDMDAVHMEIAHVSWGFEALMTRWLCATEISVHQTYMEDFSMSLDLREADFDVDMDAVCQYSLHCVKQDSAVPGDGALCAWAWEPIGLDYIPSVYVHSSAYDPYAPDLGGVTYHSWNCGDPNYDTEIGYEVTPWAMSLPSYAKLVFELPQGMDTLGYHAEPVPDTAMKTLWNDDDYSIYDALRYQGEMTLGHMELGGCSAWSYDPVSSVLTINGPWDFTYPHPDDSSLLYHGAPWIEFDVMPLSSNESVSADGSASGAVVTTASGLAGLSFMALVMSAVVLTTVMLSGCLGRRREC